MRTAAALALLVIVAVYLWAVARHHKRQVALWIFTGLALVCALLMLAS